MPKSKDAFRTISEVAEWLDVQPHVLRFWESKFSQVRPVKRAGGRRYYRPNDMLLIGGIKQLLHDDGMTIKGVQKLLREKGVKEISALSRPIDSEDIVEIEKVSDPGPVTEAVLMEEVAAAEDARTAEIRTQPEPVVPSRPTISSEPSPVPETASAQTETREVAQPKKPQVTDKQSWETRRKIIARLTEIHELEPETKPAIAQALAALSELKANRQRQVTP